jgi:hypothetical protein
MNDTKKNTIKEMAGISRTTLQKDDEGFSLDVIIPITICIIFIIYISRRMMIDGFNRYFNTSNITGTTDGILKIIGMFIFICFIFAIIYYFISSPIFTTSFKVTDIRRKTSFLDIVYSLSFIVAVGFVLTLPIIAGLYDSSSNEYLRYFGITAALLIFIMYLYLFIQNKKIEPSWSFVYLISGVSSFIALIIMIILAIIYTPPETLTGPYQLLYIFLQKTF